MADKQYGLIIPKKSKHPVVKKPSVFDNDSEEETDNRNKPTEATIDTWKSKVKKKTQLEMKKVMEEDPTVYEYDNIYDDIQKEKEVKTVDVITKDRKPKYIQSLLKAADSRKKEYERRIERSIQKEREQEGDQFKDKEAFVTSAYKKKMLEMQEQEEKERKERELEEKMDVKKQKDLSGFYRHLLKQTAGEKPVIGTSEKISGVSDEKCKTPGHEDNSVDDKQSSELIRAKKAVEELKRNSSGKRKHNSKKKRNSDSSEEEHETNDRSKSSKSGTSDSSDDSSSEESHKETKRKHKRRHENSHKHKKSKSRHNHSVSEDESRPSKYKRSKHRRSSERNSKHKRTEKRKTHHEEKHKRSRHSSDSDSD